MSVHEHVLNVPAATYEAKISYARCTGLEHVVVTLMTLATPSYSPARKAIVRSGTRKRSEPVDSMPPKRVIRVHGHIRNMCYVVASRSDQAFKISSILHSYMGEVVKSGSCYRRHRSKLRAPLRHAERQNREQALEPDGKTEFFSGFQAMWVGKMMISGAAVLK